MPAPWGARDDDVVPPAYPEPHPPVETPAPEPQPDPAFPRLLAGHPQPAAQPAAQLDDPGSDLPHAPTIPLENQ